MASSRDNEWSRDSEIYTQDQVEAVLKECGIEIRDETENDFLSYCPYHGNSDSPAFSTSKRFGVSVCFNPACAKGQFQRLTLEQLVRDNLSLNQFEAKRVILKRKNSETPFSERFDSIQFEKEELDEFPQSAIDKMQDRFWNTPAAIEYMKGRGFEEETLRKFSVGFTPETRYPAPVSKPDMIVVPAYDHKNRPVGLVGRSLAGKEFKNFGGGPAGKGFHKSKIIWNMQEARKYETIILTESTFDSMRIAQSGYPNVGALLGGSLSKFQAELLKRHHTSIINMMDNETGDDVIYHRVCSKCLRAGNNMCQGHKPGRELGMKIVETLPSMRVTWGFHDDKYIFARNVKDACAMTDDEIRQTLRNAIPHFEYLELVA